MSLDGGKESFVQLLNRLRNERKKREQQPSTSGSPSTKTEAVVGKLVEPPTKFAPVEPPSIASKFVEPPSIASKFVEPPAAVVVSGSPFPRPGYQFLLAMNQDNEEITRLGVIAAQPSLTDAEIKLRLEGRPSSQEPTRLSLTPFLQRATRLQAYTQLARMIQSRLEKVSELVTTSGIGTATLENLTSYATELLQWGTEMEVCRMTAEDST